MPTPSLIACHQCDLLQREVALPAGGAATCRRCGAVLYRRTPDSLDRTLALTLAATLLFIVTNAFPILGLQAAGASTEATLFGAVRALHKAGMTSVATLVLVTTILVPALDLGAKLYMLLSLKAGWVVPGLHAMFRFMQTVRPWGMAEVFMLGVLVSLAKLGHLAHVVLGTALWSLAVLIVLLAAAASSFDARDVWARVQERQANSRRFKAAVNAAGSQPHDRPGAPGIAKSFP